MNGAPTMSRDTYLFVFCITRRLPDAKGMGVPARAWASGFPGQQVGRQIEDGHPRGQPKGLVIGS
jgi:hypothetical protein